MSCQPQRRDHFLCCGKMPEPGSILTLRGVYARSCYRSHRITLRSQDKLHHLLDIKRRNRSELVLTSHSLQFTRLAMASALGPSAMTYHKIVQVLRREQSVQNPTNSPGLLSNRFVNPQGHSLRLIFTRSLVPPVP